MTAKKITKKTNPIAAKRKELSEALETSKKNVQLLQQSLQNEQLKAFSIEGQLKLLEELSV